MDIFNNFGLWGAGWTGWIIPFLFGLSVVVFFHELGHFLVARWCGVRVLTFSVGFGPELFGFNDRHGTRWKLSAIPLGGYVKFFGDDNAASVPDEAAVARMTEAERRYSFFHQPVGRRAAVVAAGPIANFILAIVIFATIFAIYGRQTTTARVDAVQADSAAAAAGLKPGDVVLRINSQDISSARQLSEEIGRHEGQPIVVRVGRNNQPLEFKVTPIKRGAVGVIGIAISDQVKRIEPGLLEAIKMSVQQNWAGSGLIFRTLGGLFTGETSPKQLMGPVGIAQLSGESAESGFVSLLGLMASISLNLGLLNLLPIPVLDGGHILILLLEGLTRRDFSVRVKERMLLAGFVLLMLLMVTVIYNDLTRIRWVENLMFWR